MPEVLFIVSFVAIVYAFIRDMQRIEAERQRDFALAQLAEERSKALALEARTRQARDSRGRFLGLIEGERR